MAHYVEQLYNDLLKIRTYLIKIGPGRREGKILDQKLNEANVIRQQYNTFLDEISRIRVFKDVQENTLIDTFCTKFNDLYTEILKLCNPLNIDIDNSVKMEKFDLKVALSLLPVLNDTEPVTKQLIDGIEYYGSVLDTESIPKLISFVLKNRLSQSAKLLLSTSYSDIDSLIKDIKCQLLPKKSASSIQNSLQRARQNDMSINDFGKQLSEMFVDLTIAQADGNSSSYSVLKPINEKQAIKRFADGLRNRRISTIIAARNFDHLKDAIQAAVDEELSVPSTSNEIMTMNRSNNSNKFRSGNNFYRTRSFHNKGRSYQQQSRGGYDGSGTFRSTERGRRQNNSRRGYSAPRNFNRGRSNFYNSRGNRGVRNENLQFLTESSTKSEAEKQQPENKFFRE